MANDGIKIGPWEFLRQRSFGSALAWAVLLVSALLPWGIAAGVKLYLDAQDQPTWDWLYFAQPTLILYELWATLWFALPGAGVVVACYKVRKRPVAVVLRRLSTHEAITEYLCAAG